MDSRENGAMHKFDNHELAQRRRSDYDLQPCTQEGSGDNQEFVLHQGSTLVVLCTQDASLVEQLPSGLAQRAPDIEVQVVDSLQALSKHVKHLRPDAMVIDIQSLESDDFRAFVQTPQVRRHQTIVVDAPHAQPGRRTEVMGAGYASYVTRAGEYLSEISNHICDDTRLTITQERIEETEQHYQTILEASNDGIFVLVDGLFEYINSSFTKITGFSKEQLVGHVRLVDVLGQGTDQAVAQELKRLAVSDAGQRLLNVEFDGMDGKRHLELSCRASILQGRRAVVGVARDVTIVREMEVEARRNRERVAQVERLQALGELAAGVAHDFNNAIGSILGRIELAQEKYQAGKDIAEELAVMERAARNATATVKRIQEFSRPDNKDAWEPVDLHGVVKDAIDFAQTRCPEGIAIQTDLQPVRKVHGNGEELREVLLNLINNAVDALEQKGCINITVKEDDGCAVIGVSDDGPGMDAKTQSRIFEPFFTTKGKNGTGLGLSIAQFILRRHDGDIRLHSVKGQGTRFDLIFYPLPATIQANARLTGDSLHVLVVDDDETVAEMVSDLLEEKGHRVDTADSATAALAFLQNQVPALMITDLDLPDMGGWQLARHIRGLHPEMVIGLMSGWPLGAAEKELSQRGVDFALNKPFALADLNQALEKLKKSS